MFQEACDRGQILIVGVIVIGVVALLVASSSMLLGLNSLRGATTARQSAEASALNIACSEEVLYVVRQTPTYVGSGDYILNNNNCSYSVTDIGDGQKRILLFSEVGEVIRKIEIIITISDNRISINSWQNAS